ncbi:molybdenum cofactor biosynthesis protein E [Marinomonas sp. MED121]|uniref:molybdenum cofactor biosynthesis protein MoaE n=1 Tax=Marinomonas sp. MED121 TaxID=314277 RepID=UPI000068FA50|nr:molybdenum cofactor biosynthesis protein MoaE [Marinomonas sp. MED121]EAQ64118.1 molybdenum cofactor biosynthesis protein E [Marinomonas sp. MED121]
MIKVQQDDFSVDQLYQALCDNNQTGAVAMFVGRVRDFNENDAQNTDEALFELEHYPGMTEHNLQQIVDEAHKRWDLHDVQVVHRVGQIKVLDQIVFVGVSSSHRAEAFLACDFVMDYLKSRAAFWKKEIQSGKGEWVCAKESDEQSLERWS